MIGSALIAFATTASAATDPSVGYEGEILPSLTLPASEKRPPLSAGRWNCASCLLDVNP